jgi:hypothetical protein
VEGTKREDGFGEEVCLGQQATRCFYTPGTDTVTEAQQAGRTRLVALERALPWGGLAGFAVLIEGLVFLSASFGLLGVPLGACLLRQPGFLGGLGLAYGAKTFHAISDYNGLTVDRPGW